MARIPRTSTGIEGPDSCGEKYRFLLFVAGSEAKSVQAHDNLHRVCEESLEGRYEVQVVDVLHDYRRAIDANILLAPAVALIEPAPPAALFGTLSDRARVLATLRLGGADTDDETQAAAMTRALRDCEIDAVISSEGVSLIRRGEVVVDVIRAVHEERLRLSRLLHDHLQQLLVASKMQIGIAARTVTSESATKALARAEQYLQEAFDASRKLTLELDPPALSHSGLRGGLRWLAGWMSETHGLNVDCSIGEDVEPGEEGVKLLLFHASRELLLNVVKHAETDRASLSLLRDRDQLVLTVQDYGRGMDLSNNAQPGGIGLSRIRKAVEQIGGSLVPQSNPGNGCTVVVRVPEHVTPAQSV